MNGLWALVATATSVAALTKCENAAGGTTCGGAVVEAMVQGFAADPKKFVGLTVRSNYSEFQAYFYNAGMHGCPRPCMPQEEPCVAFGSAHPGMADVAWAKHDGMVHHPEWYPELSSGSSDQEVAAALYMRGVKKCPRICKGDEREGDYVPVSEGKQSEEAWMKKLRTTLTTTTVATTEATTTTMNALEEEEPDCGLEGQTFSLLDFPGHMPVQTASGTACRDHCKAQPEGTYFNYFVPLETCHCPPEETLLVKVPGDDFIGGAVNCETDFVKRVESMPKVEWARNVTGGFLLALSGLVALISVPLVRRRSGVPDARSLLTETSTDVEGETE